MLEVFDLEVTYGPIRALSGITFTVPEGRIVALLGANGAGKTTTMRAVAGLVTPRSGRIAFQGEEIQGKAPHIINRRGIAVCPEGRRIFSNLTVLENLLLGGYGRRDKKSFSRDVAGIFRYFPRLEERQHQRAGTLSGGELQMLAIGRALMSRPRLLLLDEPSLGLAPLLVREVFHIIETLNTRGTTILLVEQNAFAALNIAHYGYILENGRLVLEGSGSALLANPHLRQVYLGNGLDY
jgi:branched-chain amino acid transport system ATP-binding protein